MNTQRGSYEYTYECVILLFSANTNEAIKIGVLLSAAPCMAH